MKTGIKLYVWHVFHFQTVTGSSDGRETAQYPTFRITSSVQRDTIKNALAKPLAEQGRVGMAFRILWRGHEEAIWKQILTHRSAFDRFLKNTNPGISLMVSSITGMIAKSQNPSSGKIANPGIAYWIVLESAEVDPRSIVRNVQGALQGQAEVKLLQEPPLMRSLDTMHNTLCTVMKDHSNSYIKRRIAESQLEQKGDSAADRGYATRLVFQSNDLAAFAQQAHEILHQGGVFVDLIQY